MDARTFMDLLTESAREVAYESRARLRSLAGGAFSGLKTLSKFGLTSPKGMAIAGLATIFLGGGIIRSAIKLGSMAAVAAVGVRTYRKWKAIEDQSDGSGQNVQRVDEDSPEAKEAYDNQVDESEIANDVQLTDGQVETLLATMIAAAKADGRIDETEMGNIESYIDTLGELDDDVLHFMKNELNNDRSIESLAEMSSGLEESSQMYLAALVAISIDNIEEMQWLEDFAAALGLSEDLKRMLENQVSRVTD